MHRSAWCVVAASIVSCAFAPSVLAQTQTFAYVTNQSDNN
jgi:hypothetical protein